MVIVRLVLLTSLLMIVSAGLTGTAFAEGSGTHTVQPGETLAIIAAQHGITVRALAAANDIRNPNLVRVSQKLVIPGGSPTKPAAKPDIATADAGTISRYVVKPGQTLAQIAALLGVSGTAIARANGIDDPDLIRSGQALIIPNGAKEVGAPQQTPGSRFVASISQQRCWLYKDGELIGDWRCSTGRKGTPTVPGSYRVQSKINPAYASTWGFWMPYWMGIYWAGSVENGIHGLPYDPKTGRRTWQGLVGTPITYGCIMLDDENVKKVYEVAYIGMPVIILP